MTATAHASSKDGEVVLLFKTMPRRNRVATAPRPKHRKTFRGVQTLEEVPTPQPSNPALEAALRDLSTDVVTSLAFENSLKARAQTPQPQLRCFGGGERPDIEPETMRARLDRSIRACQAARAEHLEQTRDELRLKTHEELSQLARFTHDVALAPYAKFLHFVPRLVNVVTLAEALPVEGSGVSLPLDLHRIASTCVGAFYAPRRFAAVQLAFSNPRCRVLVFHTGRLVGTGTSGAAASRLAILRAQQQLATEAGVFLHVKTFNIINQVGAVSLNASINCDAFSAAHSESSHFDRASFVGLAWRPKNEHICCEVYSTGRANLPGSTSERLLLESFARMLPELLRFSSAHSLLEHISESQQAHHRADASRAGPSSAPVVSRKRAAKATPTPAKKCKVKMMEVEEEAIADDEEESHDIWGDWGENDRIESSDLAALGL
ncbi:MAG: hypothetical protein VXA08_02345 [Alphaproteobacteria bacterium]